MLKLRSDNLHFINRASILKSTNNEIPYGAEFVLVMRTIIKRINAPFNVHQNTY